MKTKKLVTYALFIALTCVATMIVRIPTGTTAGYVNLGDCLVLLSAYFLGPIGGAVCAGIGSSLADILSSYMIYAIPTLIIKALVAFTAGIMFNKFFKTKNNSLLLVNGLIAEMIMVFGYFIFEAFLYGPVSAATALFPNSLQAIFGVVSSTLLYAVLSRNKAFMKSMSFQTIQNK
ncbi:MAG: ECF transporter S component [Clostridia bacterium]|nr:ECF transporter S component [Clostridia bacterium]